MKVYIDKVPIEEITGHEFNSVSLEVGLKQLLGPWFECMVITRVGQELQIDIYEKTPLIQPKYMQ